MPFTRKLNPVSLKLKDRVIVTRTEENGTQHKWLGTVTALNDTFVQVLGKGDFDGEDDDTAVLFHEWLPKDSLRLCVRRLLS